MLRRLEDKYLKEHLRADEDVTGNEPMLHLIWTSWCTPDIIDATGESVKVDMAVPEEPGYLRLALIESIGLN